MRARGLIGIGGIAAALALALVGFGGSAGAGPGSSAAQPLYGIVGAPGAPEAELARLDPRTLAPLAKGRIPVGPFREWPRRSPDGSLLALLDAELARVKVIDLPRLRPLLDVALASDARWHVRALEWLTADRIVALLQRADARNVVEARELVVVDPLAGRIIARRALADRTALLDSVAAGDKLVLLLGRADWQGRLLRLLVLDSSGAASAPVGFDRGPGRRNAVLVAAPDGSRVFVVTADAPVAELDPATLKLGLHRVTGDGSFLKRRDLSIRRALAIDGDTIAVAGFDSVAANGVERTTGSGLALVDTHTWSARLVDRSAGEFSYASGTLLVHGWRSETSRYAGRPGRITAQRIVGNGLTAYSREGKRLYHLFGSRWLSARPVRDVAIVSLQGPPPFRRGLIELATGRTLVAPGRVASVALVPDAPQPVRSLSVANQPAASVEGDGERLTGTAGPDVARIVLTRVDGSSHELALDAERRFSYTAPSPEEAGRLLRAEAADGTVLSTIELQTPSCGGAAGPCPAVRQPQTAAEPAQFAIVPGARTASLAQVDPRTLRPLRGRVLPLGNPYPAFARSPDGAQLAVGDRGGYVRFVDLPALTSTRQVRLAGPRATVRALAWVAPRRLLAIVQEMRPHSGRVAWRKVYVVDPRTARALAARPVTNKLALGPVSAAGGRLAALLSPSDHTGSTVELLVADAQRVRTLTLEIGRRGGALQASALALAPGGARAFVFASARGSGAGRMLDVDLEAMRATARTLRVAPGTKLTEAAIFSMPPVAAPLDETHVAVRDAIPLRGGGNVAAGVFVVDTTTFTARLADPGAMSFEVAGGKLVAWGRDNRRAAAALAGIGVRVYDASGAVLYRLYGQREFTGLLVGGRYGHALPSPRRPQLLFDAESGRSLGPQAPVPGGLRLIPDASPPARTPAASAGDPFTRISNRGTPVVLTRVQRRVLERLGLPPSRTVSLLGKRAGAAFYRFTGREGRSCFAAGKAWRVGEFGPISCPEGFPSRKHPALVLSGIVIRNASGTPLLGKLQGIAADGVAAVELRSASGKTVARVPVEGNVYARRLPRQVAAGSIAAVDAQGRVLWSLAAQRQVPPPPSTPANPPRLRGYGVTIELPRAWTGRLYAGPRSGSGPILLAANFPLPPFRSPSTMRTAAEKMPATGIMILLSEAGAGTGFPPLIGPLRLERGEFRSQRNGHAVAVHDFRVEGRLLQAIVETGARAITEGQLAQVNRVLATLRVSPPPRPAGPPIQRGEGDGFAVEVYRSRLIVFRVLDTSAPAYRLLAGANVSAGCLNARPVSGGWDANEWTAWKPFAGTLTASFAGSSAAPRPPYDGCEIRGSYGRKWGTARGYHSAVEVPFNERARRFFAERAVARELAYFIRSPALSEIRRQMKRGRPAPPASEIARRFPDKVVPLAGHDSWARPGLIAVRAAGDLIEVSQRTSGGRRLWIRIRAGRIAGHNVEGLAFVF